MRKFSKLFKNKGFVIVASVTAVILIVSCILILWHTAISDEKLAENVSLTVYIAFDRLNDIIRMAEGIVEDNSDFFDDRYALNQHNSKFVNAVNAAKNIRSACPFVEEVVFYQEDSERLITTTGSISKDRFFNYAYETAAVDIEYWNGIMNMYNTPTIIPVYEYTVLSYPESIKNLFVMPKIYNLYGIGVLIFVNEQMFWDYCGLNGKGYQVDVALYNSGGNLIISNYPAAKKYVEPSGLRNKKRGAVNLLGEYTLEEQFNYEDLIFRFSSANPTVAVSLAVLVALAVLLAVMGTLAVGKLEAVSGRGYAFGELLSELIPDGTSEKALSSNTQAILLEFRGFLNELGGRAVSREDKEGGYWHESSMPLKISLSKHIAARNMIKVVEDIKADVVGRIEKGISYDMLAYHLFDLYMTVVYSLKNGKEFFKDTHTIELEGLKRCYLYASGEGMINLTMNLLHDAQKYIEPENLDKIKDVLAYLDKNYTQSLFIDTVAAEFRMSPKYFSGFFKKYAGVSFVEYITKLKLERALELLLTTDKSVREISEMVGYVADNTFMTAFKKYYGKPPKEYKKSSLRRD